MISHSPRSALAGEAGLWAALRLSCTVRVRRTNQPPVEVRRTERGGFACPLCPACPLFSLIVQAAKLGVSLRSHPQTHNPHTHTHTSTHPHTHTQAHTFLCRAHLSAATTVCTAAHTVASFRGMQGVGWSLSSPFR